MKKLSSVLLALLLATSGLLVFAPLMPAKGFFQPELFVTPGKSKFYSPCIVSTEFDVSVKLWNQKEETGVGIYAFEFCLCWFNNTLDASQSGCPPMPDAGACGCLKDPLIDLVKIDIKPPWPEGEYFIIRNETVEGIWKGFWWIDPQCPDDWTWVSGYFDCYCLSITALNTAPTLDDVKIPVVDLTFHIVDEPCFKGYVDEDGCGVPTYWWWSPFHLQDTEMSACGGPLPHGTEDGKYEIIPQKPEMWVVTEKSLDPDDIPCEPPIPNPCDWQVAYPPGYYIVRWTNCSDFTVDIEVKNVCKMYAFAFKLMFNATLLNTDVQKIHIKDFLPPPYEYLWMDVNIPSDPCDVLAYVEVCVRRPCEKPPVCGTGFIVNIDFHTKCPCNCTEDFECNYILPSTAETTLWFEYAFIATKVKCCGETKVWAYECGYVEPPCCCGICADQIEPLNCFAATYWFIPKLEDLDQSGHVDILDLSAIAKQYGKSGNQWADSFAKLADPTNTPVDLFDVVRVAKQFCKPYTPLDPYTGEPYDP